MSSEEYTDPGETMDPQRMRPYDLEAERAVLGSMMLSTDAIREVTSSLSGREFYEPKHLTVYDAICARTARGEPVDPLTTIAELDRTGDLQRIGGPGYIQHDLVQAVPTTAHAPWYAERLRELAAWRGLIETGTELVARGYRADGDAHEALERAVADVQALRDRGLEAADVPVTYLDDFLNETDDEPEWVVPGLLARWERLIVTAGEGGGKSLMLRQMAMRAAAGLHPFKRARIAPAKVMLVDVENSRSQARPWLRRMAAAAAEEGAPIDPRNVVVEIPERPMDLTVPADRAYLARRVEQEKPDLLVIGPLYKLTLTGNPSDEEVARSLMSALEMLRTASGGAAMLIEAHSPHAAPGVKRRDLRPIGSSLWLRWPEFGFGLSPAHGLGAEEQRLMDWVPWRGSRSERAWPEQFCEGVTWPWQAIEYAGNAPADAGITVDDPVGLRTMDHPLGEIQEEIPEQKTAS